MNKSILKPFPNKVKKFAFKFLLLLSVSTLLGMDKGQEDITALEKRSGLIFGTKAKVLFHAVDSQRLPGYTEWIIAAPSFAIGPRTFPNSSIKMFNSDSLQKSLMLRIDSLNIKGAKNSYRARWSTAAGENFTCDILLSDSPPLLFLVKEP